MKPKRISTGCLYTLAVVAGIGISFLSAPFVEKALIREAQKPPRPKPVARVTNSESIPESLPADHPVRIQAEERQRRLEALKAAQRDKLAEEGRPVWSILQQAEKERLEDSLAPVPESLPADHSVRIYLEDAQREDRALLAKLRCAEYAGEFGNRQHWEWDIAADLGEGRYEVSWIYRHRGLEGDLLKTLTLFTCIIEDGAPVALRREKEWERGL